MLNVAGFVPCSTVDWPSKIVGIYFTQGCNLNCAYCHNKHLLDPNVQGIDINKHTDWLIANRKEKLDGIIFSGGEPLIQHKKLIPILNKLKPHFKLGIHTNGTQPKSLKEVLDKLDWVGLDFKEYSKSYLPKFKESLEYLISSKKEFEVRTTVDNTLKEQALDFMECFLLEHDIKTWYLQQIKNRAEINYKSDKIRIIIRN